MVASSRRGCWSVLRPVPLPLTLDIITSALARMQYDLPLPAMAVFSTRIARRRPAGLKPGPRMACVDHPSGLLRPLSICPPTCVCRRRRSS